MGRGAGRLVDLDTRHSTFFWLDTENGFGRSLGSHPLSLPDRFIPAGDYTPDQADFGNAGTARAENVVPRTATSYSPMPSFQTAATTGLAGAPLGAFSTCDSAGNAANYAGTTAKLYALTNATKPNFADRSGAVYTTPTGYVWSFTEALGNVYAANGNDAIQKVQTATASNFANHPDANAPKARYLAYIQPGFLVCGDINDPTVGIQPQGIRWGALGNPDSFPLVGSSAAIAANSDWQAVTGPHGRFRGFAPNLASCNAALFFEQAVFRMIFTGGSKIFDIQPVEKLRGTQAPGSIIQVGQIAYFLSPNGFFAFDGTQAIPFGEGKINNTFFADADPNYLSQVQGAADPVSGLCFWCYAGVGNVGGTPNRILVYHPPTGRWSLIVNPAGNNLFVGRTLGTSLDGIDALGFTLDTLPYSLDSSVLAGGNLALAGFDSSNKLGFFTGPNMAFTVDTAEVQLIPGRLAKISAVRPSVEGDTCSAAVGGRSLLSAVPSFGAANTQNAYGLCCARNEARYQRVRLTASAGNLVKHIRGAEVTYSPGARR
jgi:hypothetical protein